MEEILVVISCFVNIILWLFLFFYFKKRFSSQEMLEDIRQEFEKLLNDIQGQTDRDISLVDGKSKELKDLIENADQRIKAIKREQRRQKKDEAESIKAQKLVTGTEPVTMLQNPVYPLGNIVNRYVGNSEVVSTRAETVISPNPTPSPSDVTKNDKPVREKVLELWKLGMEPELIAEKLTVSLTEIRMIIDMYA